MEMNFAYYEATLAHLRSKGFAVEVDTDTHEIKAESIFSRHRARCVLDELCQISFEALQYTSGHEDFYLEIISMGRMRSFSFPLDSWKFHPNRIEFKYRSDPETGLGLALTLNLAD